MKKLDFTRVEYRVQHLLSEPWESICPCVTIEIASKRLSRQKQLADKIGLAIARGEDAFEVRWNFVGSYQGHYVRRRMG